MSDFAKWRTEIINKIHSTVEGDKLYTECLMETVPDSNPVPAHVRAFVGRERHLTNMTRDRLERLGRAALLTTDLHTMAVISSCVDAVCEGRSNEKEGWILSTLGA